MKTYDEILSVMLSEYESYAGFKPDEASDVYMKFQVLSGELLSLIANLDWTKRQMFLSTATGDSLDNHAQSRGLSRKKPQKAKGIVSFMLLEPALFDIEIPKGTVVSTAGEEPLRFETDTDALISAGTVQTMVEATALSPGKASNVIAGSVEVLVTAVAGVERVTNPDPFIGGEDMESDEKLRDRIAESLRIPSTGANVSYYKNLALSVDCVTGVCVVPKARGIGTIDVYVSTLNGEYDDSELDLVRRVLDEGRQVNVDLKVVNALPLSIDLSFSLELEPGYSLNEAKENCKIAIEDYLISVGVGGKVLLNHLGEKLYHTEGVKDYLFADSMDDIICENTQYPKLGNLTISEGIDR